MRMNKKQKQDRFENSELTWEANCENYAKLILMKIEVLPHVDGMAINADVRQCSWRFNDSDYTNVLNWSEEAIKNVDTTKKVNHSEYVEEHSVPVAVVCALILSLEEKTVEAIKEILVNLSAPTIVTKEEDDRLKGMTKSMPSNWDGVDHLARYKAVGIKVVENPNGRK